MKCHEEAEVRFPLRVNVTIAGMIGNFGNVQEFGGYFIINGNERIIRMLVLPRRNYVCLRASVIWMLVLFFFCLSWWGLV